VGLKLNAKNRMHRFMCFVLLLLVCLVEGQMDCTQIRGPSGEFYDLSAIIGKELITNDTFSFYKVTVCKDGYPDCGGCSMAGYCQTNEFFHDCVGKFAGASILSDGRIQILYDRGDFGNTGRVLVKCNPLIDDIGNVRPEQFNKVTTCESKHACPSIPKLDPGYPFPIRVPGYFSVTAPVEKGVAVTVAQPMGSYKLNITLLCTSGNCLFKTLLLDSTNFQNFLASKPYVCLREWCDQLWEQFNFSEDIQANGSMIYVLVLPQQPAVLQIRVAAMLPSVPKLT